MDNITLDFEEGDAQDVRRCCHGIIVRVIALLIRPRHLHNVIRERSTSCLHSEGGGRIKTWAENVHFQMTMQMLIIYGTKTWAYVPEVNQAEISD